MASRVSPEGLSSASARHPWRTIGMWIVVLMIAGAYALGGLGDVITSDIKLTADYESVVGFEKLDESPTLSNASNPAETLLIQSNDGTTVDDPAFAKITNNTVSTIRALQGEWEGQPPKGAPSPLDLLSGDVKGSFVLNYYELKQFAPKEVEQLVSKDRSILLVPVTFAQDSEDVPIEEYVDTVETLGNDRFSVLTIGTLSINEAFGRVAGEDLVQGEMIGIPIALVVLVAVFGALVAPGLPLVLGIFSIGTALGIVTLAGQFEPLQLFIENMVTMLGLAIGIDYSLFIVERYREQRNLGYDRQRAIEISGGTAGKAVLFSGLTVILALIGVMIVPFNIFFSLGLGAVIVVAIAVCLTLTLLPAMLSLLGDRINWPRKTPPAVSGTEANVDIYHGFWGRITKIVVDRPAISAILAVITLLVLASPVLDLKTGFTGAAQMPKGPVTEAYGILENEFSAGLLGPVEFVFEGEHTREADTAIKDLQQRLMETGEFVPFTEPVRWDDEAGLAVLTGTMTHGPSIQKAYDLIDRIRNEIIPETTGQVDGLETWVTGQSATENDLLTMLGNRTPYVFAFVLSLSFVLLMLAFRSLVVPIQAIVFNLLSVGATWGIMVAVFSKGILRDVLGYSASPVIESWIPILLFCILFGLSMDYHVFILSRIREHYDISQDNHESVAIGLRTTGKIITGAALIMVVVFGAFSTGSLLALQQLGFGLAVAVFLDATVVRSVLVPSVMTLFGDRNWWLPRWLNWLPDFRIEGEAPEPAVKESDPEEGLPASTQ